MEAVIQGYISEIFSSIQGEGLHVGERHLFIRFAGCNLSCNFCDTQSSRRRSDVCRIEMHPGKRDFTASENPISVGDALSHVKRLNTDQRHVYASITGGEPLMQPEFLFELASALRGMGLPVLLETNGTLPDELQKVKHCIDVISTDIKLQSACSVSNLQCLHEDFLKAASGKEIYVKIILTSTTSTNELIDAIKMIEAVSPEIPLVLQPVTPRGKCAMPTPEQLLDWQAQCMLYLNCVRVIPQCHRIIGVL